MRVVLARTTIIAALGAAAALWTLRGGRIGAGGVGMAAPFLSAWADAKQEVLGRGVGGRMQELETRVEELELELARLQGAEAENRELRKLLLLRPAPGFRYEVAEVIARDPATWYERFRIGKGQRDGVTPGALVVADGVAIGRVAECRATSAVAMTVADPACRLSVVVGPGAVPGVLCGGGRGTASKPGECRVEFLPSDLVCEGGWLVRTSGLGRVSPYGVPVGIVTGSETAGASRRAVVEPLRELGRVAYVAVLCPDGTNAPGE